MTDLERPGAGDLEPVRARSTACHCGRTVEPRDPDPWEGRMNDYCEDCAINRCDCYPEECPVKHPQASSAARRRCETQGCRLAWGHFGPHGTLMWEGDVQPLLGLTKFTRRMQRRAVS